MNEATPRVIVIPPKPEYAQGSRPKRQLRVAAYCRVSTDNEEQLTSYEAQQAYYTEKIMTNPQWSMAGIFADRGLTGTTTKRPEFQRLMRLCRQKKVDLILTKSLSRFARNTLDCLKYVRALKELGIPVIFEKESINTMETQSEMLLTFMGAFAQGESESTGSIVWWGKEQARKAGITHVQFNRLYGYRIGENENGEIVPEQAEVVREIYKQFLSGSSFRMIKESLEAAQVQSISGTTGWTTAHIRSILTNEKYCGDVLMCKTFKTSTIDGKVVKNTGQRPMYYVADNHPAIVDRTIFYAAKSELARRSAVKSPSKSAPTGMGCYSGKYALTERLFCGECDLRGHQPFLRAGGHAAARRGLESCGHRTKGAGNQR